MNAQPLAMIHPEDLIDRASKGALDAAARAKLDAHLSACAACRFELAVRADFASEITGTVDTSALIRNALALQARPPKRRPVMARVAVIVGVCLVGAVATASPAGQYAITVLTRALQTVLSQQATRQNGAMQPANVDGHVAPKANVPAAVTAAVPDPTNIKVKRPADANVDGHGHVAPKVDVPAAVTVAVPGPNNVNAHAEANADIPVNVTAAELLSLALAARRDNHLDQARDHYLSLITQFPASSEAALSLVALGRIELDANHADDALTHFDRYLSSPGPLEEEALAGKARALMKLSRHADEAAAWQRLLERFPSSIHEPRARERLSELGEP